MTAASLSPVAEAPSIGLEILDPAAGVLLDMLHAAARAPSADNVQPWRLELHAAARRLDVLVDHDRDRSPLNAGQRMSYLACGAAVENAMRIARAAGFCCRLELSGLPAIPNERYVRVAALHLERHDGSAHTADRLRAAELINARATNRRIYDGRVLDLSAVAVLKESAPVLNGFRTHWIIDRTTTEALTPLLARGDAAMFGLASARDYFISTVRFDLRPDAAALEGFSLASLEISAWQSLALRCVRHTPDPVFRALGGPELFSSHTKKLARSASGLCIITVENSAQDHPVQAGRALQSAWLALTAQGFAAQPMMSVLGIANALERGTPDLVASLQRAGGPELTAAFRSLLAQIGILEKPVFMLRFGFARAPSGRTGRRSDVEEARA